MPTPRIYTTAPNNRFVFAHNNHQENAVHCNETFYYKRLTSLPKLLKN